MNPIDSLLNHYPVLVIDGALATELERRGRDLQDELWSTCVRRLEAHPQIAAIGINCTSPKYMPSLIREATKATKKPILVYPNSCETYNASMNAWNGNPVLESSGEQAREWYHAGARLIGGCCRTTPEDIRVIASWARNMA